MIPLKLTPLKSNLMPTINRKTNKHSIMKAKHVLLATVITASGLIVACTKNNSTGSSGASGSTTTADVQTESNDVTQVSNEMDAMNNDVNNSLNASATFSGATSYNGGAADGNGVVTEGGGGSINLDYSICDATVTTDTTNGLRQVIITYNGTNCWGNRTRTGVVVISIPVGVRWRDSGAVVTVSIQNLKITRIRDNKTITLNGTYTYTNVTGGLLKDFATLGTLTH